MPITRGGFADLLTPELRVVYVETGKERPLEHPVWINNPDMPWNPVTDKQISGLGIMPRKDEGDQFTTDDPIDGRTREYTAVPYGLAVEVTKEAFDDDLYGPMRENVRLLAQSSRHRLEVDAHEPLNRAFGTTMVGFTAGEALCAVTHTGLDGVVRSNRPAVDIGLSQTAIQDGVDNFENLTNERDLPALLNATLLIIDSSNKFLAREILGSPHKTLTAQNEINALLDEDLTFLVSHYLNTATNWFLLASKGAHDINFFVRNPPEFGSFTDPWTGNAVFTSYQRHVSGWGSWRGIYGSTG